MTSSKRSPQQKEPQDPRPGLPAVGSWLQAVAPTPTPVVASRAAEAERQMELVASAGRPARAPERLESAPLPLKARQRGAARAEERDRQQPPPSFLVKLSSRLHREAELATGNEAAAKVRLADALLAFHQGDYEVARARLQLAKSWDPTGEMTGAVGRRLSELLERQRNLADLLPKTS